MIFGLLSLAGLASGQVPPGTAPTAFATSQGYVDFHQRWQDYLFRTYTDPTRFGWLLVDSAKDTWWKSPRQWDQSAQSFSYRVASSWGRRMVRNTLQLGFETALREDSRYRPSNAHGFRKRVWFAVASSVLAYSNDGSMEPAYGRIAADVATTAISSTWHPRSIAAGSLLGGMVDCSLDRAANNLLREFQPDLLHFGRTAWNALLRR